MYIEWGSRWDDLSEILDDAKEEAKGTPGAPVADGTFLVLPGGKQPCYRWHLQWPEFHLYLGRSAEPHGNTPNGYVSLNAKTLWSLGVPGAVALVTNWIERLEGKVLSAKPSRCDLAADFRLPAGLSLPFLLAHRVPQHVTHSHIMTGESLETFYHGAKKTPVQLRIYDKAKEVLQGGTKLWFYDLWNVEPEACVWRIEFQIRRERLKEFSIHTVEDLVEKSGGLWRYLTEDWFSLRAQDDSNTSRRTVLPWWQVVQACAEQFGPSMKLTRTLDSASADSAWYVNHIAGCTVGFAAREQLKSLDEALPVLVERVRAYFERNDFRRKLTVKSIQLGYPVSSGTAEPDASVPGMESEA
ncbi:MAG: hypothetical protein C0478_06050 [Planctomyces sp.]|nr:hypothetical protein [Planctomyces sp.]